MRVARLRSFTHYPNKRKLGLFGVTVAVRTLFVQDDDFYSAMRTRVGSPRSWRANFAARSLGRIGRRSGGLGFPIGRTSGRNWDKLGRIGTNRGVGVAAAGGLVAEITMIGRDRRDRKSKTLPLMNADLSDFRGLRKAKGNTSKGTGDEEPKDFKEKFREAIDEHDEERSGWQDHIEAIR
jgi:hypothetical protein